MIYLDHAASAPVLPEAARAVYEVLSASYANPSAQYPAGQEMRRQVAQWRQTVAAALECPPERFFFTSGGTESDVWALRAACWQGRHTGRHIVTTAVEHSAVKNCCLQLQQEGWQVTYVKPDSGGGISAEAVLQAVGPETAVVSVMLVNNELGCIYPVEEIAAGLKARYPKALLHTDAVQGFLTLPCSARSLGADFLAVSAHKIGGPKGIGGLYISPRVAQPRPLLPGGGQEGGLRSGTEATAQMAGFAAAVSRRLSRLEQDRQHLSRLNGYARQALGAIPDLLFVGSGGAPHILAVSLSGWPGGNAVTDLGEQGICISTGSACHRGRDSHVVSALGLPRRVAAGVLRISFGPETAQADIDALASALRRHHDTRMPLL